MKKFDMYDLIQCSDEKITLKKLKNLSVGILAPIAIKGIMEHFIRGNFYVRLNRYPQTALSIFLKRKCHSLIGSDNLQQQDFYELVSNKSSRSEDYHFYSLVDGNLYLSKNMSLIFIRINKKKSRNRERINNILYIVGPNFKKDLILIRQYHEEYLKVSNDIIRMKSLKDNRLQFRVKSEEAVFSDQKTIVLESINQIFYKFRVAKKFMISSTSAMILHGPPGTGKSLLTKLIVRYINDRYGKEYNDGFRIVYVTKSELDGNKFIKKLIDQLNDDGDDSVNVLIIDDCDMVMRPRGTVAETKHENNITADIMNLLDNGIPGYTNPLLVLMTTNFIEKVDPAILRPGRTDSCIEITNLSIKTAMEMCAYYNIDLYEINDINKIISTEKEINPARLQQAIIDTKSKL